MSREPSWSADDVLRAADAWVWVPEDAERFTTADLDVVAYPPHFAMPTQVLRSSAARPTQELVEQAREVSRAWGRSELFWRVTPASPQGLEEVLVAKGGVLTEETAILAIDTTEGVPDLAVPAEFTVRRVDDEQSLRACEEIAAAAFGSDPPPEERYPAALACLASDWELGTGFRSVVYLGGDPVATGGCTIAGPVARLWGAGSHAEFRGRGAYRAVLDHRLKVAREFGATLGLVKGRVDTSGPILLRAGFTSYGVERCFRIPVRAG